MAHDQLLPPVSLLRSFERLEARASALPQRASASSAIASAVLLESRAAGALYQLAQSRNPLGQPSKLLLGNLVVR